MESASQVFTQLNTYHSRVNADMLKHLEMVNPQNARIGLLISHIINAHQIWLERIHGNSTGTGVFALRTYEELKAQNERNYDDTERVIKEKDLAETIIYTNTKGQKFMNSISDMLLHVFNHNAYHRGQINQLLVQEVKPAMVSDYIVYHRTELFDV